MGTTLYHKHNKTMIQLLKGSHLTATDKKHIDALLKSGHAQAKINRTIWVIERGIPSENEYTLSKYVKDRGLGFIGNPLRQSKYTFTIKYTK